MTKQKTEQVSEAFPDAYTLSAPALLSNLHEYLFDSIEQYFAGKSQTERSLLVIGPGPQALPFSQDRKRLKNMMGDDSKLVFMDCVFDAEKVGKSVLGLAKVGLFDDNYFSLGAITNEEIDLGEIDKNTISYQAGDLNEPLKFRDESFECIDATLAIHHATPFEKDLDKITQDVYRVLKPGGFFHFGTGQVDMKRSERKLEELAKDVLSLYKTAIVEIMDERNPEYVRKTSYNKENGQGHVQIKIDETGTAYLPKNRDLKEHLEAKRYAITVCPNDMTTPLIDSNNNFGDYKEMIQPVSEFYQAIREMAAKGVQDGLIDQETADKVYSAAIEEQANAEKGIVEHYTGEERVLESLEKAGFNRIRVQKHEEGPFYNITAHKPTDEEAIARDAT